MEYKLGIKSELKQIDEEGVFEGYASVFGNVDSDGEIVDKGAFSKTLRENDGRFPLVWFHSPFEPVGIAQAEEDDRGLLIKRGELDLDVAKGREVHSGMRRGYIDRFSFGFRRVKEGMEDGVNHIKEVRLLEISPITRNFAANDQALLTDVRSLPGMLERAGKDMDRETLQRCARALQKALEGAGCGCGGGKGAKGAKGQNLAAALNDLIEDQTDDETSRADVVQAMAQAAGITPGTVNAILNADINCPPLNRLRGFASALGTSLTRLRELAESDGCDFENESRSNQYELEILKSELQELKGVVEPRSSTRQGSEPDDYHSVLQNLRDFGAQLKQGA